jgi:STE24 endopeptidase
LKLRRGFLISQSVCILFALIFPCVSLLASPHLGAATLQTGPAHFASETDGPPQQNANSTYTLPPDKLAKAIRLTHDRTILQFAEEIWGILFLLLLLGTRVLSRLGHWAESITPRRWLQSLIFLPILLILISLSNLPLTMTGHWLSTSYGISIQRWGGWFLDQGKSLLLTLAIGTLILGVLFWLIRKYPRRWWVLFWAGSVPFVIIAVFVVPVVIDPMFNHFEPLSKTNPQLVIDLGKVVARTGTNIPPERMYLMKASEKLTVPNAYVTGIGATKRVVVWDTTIKMAPTDDILFIFGHESGHYVLNHIWKAIAFLCGLLLVMMWAGYHIVNWLIARFGERWQIRSIQDWAAVGVLLVVISMLSFVSDPIGNTYSRSQEHDADIYGQEAVHGIVANPQATAQHAFQLLGEAYLDDPNPSPFFEFWTYDHPSIARRAAFAAAYNPWTEGKRPKYFPEDHAK